MNAVESGKISKIDTVAEDRRGENKKEKTTKAVHTWLAGFPGRPSLCGRGGVRIPRSRPFVLARSCPVVPQVPAGRAVGLCGSGPPGFFVHWTHCNLEQVLGARNPTRASQRKKQLTRSSGLCPGLPGSPSPKRCWQCRALGLDFRARRGHSALQWRA